MSDQTRSSGDDETVVQTSVSGGRTHGMDVTLPARLGDYMLVEHLGHGAMGQVYRADQLEPVRRQVAIKFMATERVDAELLARFDAEGQALARMSHPCIAAIHDAGTSPAGRPYFVMEFVDGPTLLEYCQSHELGLAARLELFHGICAAMAHAHQKGIIHRDIKPSNILVAEQDGEAVPKVIDFGLAKALTGNLADRSLHTHVGTVLGTPAFMSPEQAAMTGREIDTRSDIYALGLVLYQMLTGCLPFKRLGEGDSTIEQVLRAVREDDPMRPSQRVATVDAGDLPAGLDHGVARALRQDLDWIILKCLAKKPEDRYQSVNDLLADLERYHKHQPVQARRSTTGYVLAKMVRRYRWPLAVVVVVLVLGAILGGGWLNSRADAAAQARAAQQFGQTVQRMDTMLRVAHLLPLHDVSPVRAEVQAMIDNLRQKLPSMPRRSRAVGHYAIGRGLLDLGQDEQALKALDKAWISGYQEPQAAYALGLAYGRLYENARARAMSLPDKNERQQELAQARTMFLDPALHYLHEGAATGAESTVYGEAMLAFYEGKDKRARELAEQAFAHDPSLYEAIVLTGETWGRQAQQAWRSGDSAAATEGFVKAYAAFERASTVGRSDSVPYFSRCNLAGDWLHFIMYGAGTGAEEVFQQAHESCRKAIAINPKSIRARARTANLILVHGQVVEDTGKNPMAIYRQALAAAEAVADMAPDTSDAWITIGTAWQRIAMYQMNYANESPIDALAEAGKAYHRLLVLDRGRKDVRNELGNVYSIRGEYIFHHGGGDPMPDLLAAVKTYEEGLAIKADDPVLQSNLAFNCTIIANYLASKGHDPGKWFARAFAIYDKLMADNPGFALGRINLADTLYFRGEYAKEQHEDPLPWWRKSSGALDILIKADPMDYYAWRSRAGLRAAEAMYLEAQGRDPVAAAREAIEAAGTANGIRSTADVWTYQAQAMWVLAQHADRHAEAQSWRQKAEHALHKALELDPEYKDALKLQASMQSVRHNTT